MSVKLTDLQCKEVICISDGRRLGFITDILVEVPEGKICAIVVPGPCKVLGVMGRHDDYVVSWDCIRRIAPISFLWTSNRKTAVYSGQRKVFCFRCQKPPPEIQEISENFFKIIWK